MTRRRPVAYLGAAMVTAPVIAAVEGGRLIGRRVAKADRVEELPIPGWARDEYTMLPPPSRRVLGPLDMYAGSRMMAFGLNNMKGKVNWPWRKDRMARGGYQFNQSRGMVYNPIGYGRAQ
jgi:hypothetical protein